MGRIFSLIFVLSLLFGVAACASESSLSEELPADSEGESCKSAIPQLSDSRWEREETLRITVKGSVLEAKLYKNETAQAFASLLPLTLEMSAMPHEKYGYLPSRLPSSAKSVERIQAGDLMLWGNDCLVLFYESFSTSYSYTPVARIADCEGLAEVLGSGGAPIAFALEG